MTSMYRSRHLCPSRSGAVSMLLQGYAAPKPVGSRYDPAALLCGVAYEGSTGSRVEEIRTLSLSEM